MNRKKNLRTQNKSVLETQEIRKGRESHLLQESPSNTEQQEFQNTIKAEIRNQTYFGPIPPPKFLEEYAKIDPNFPERIMTMAEKSLDIKNNIINYNYSLTSRGQRYAVYLVSAAFLTSIILAFMGMEKATITALAVAGGLSWLIWRPEKKT